MLIQISNLLMYRPAEHTPVPSDNDAGFPGLSNQNDRFRQKQADMKKEMKKDFQNYVQQNQSIDPRKQKIQKQRQNVQDVDQWGRAQSFSKTFSFTKLIYL